MVGVLVRFLISDKGQPIQSAYLGGGEGGACSIDIVYMQSEKQTRYARVKRLQCCCYEENSVGGIIIDAGIMSLCIYFHNPYTHTHTHFYPS